MSVMVPLDIPSVSEDGEKFTINTWQLLQHRAYAKARAAGRTFSRKNTCTAEQMCERYRIDREWCNWPDIARYLDFVQEDVDQYLAALKSSN